MVATLKHCAPLLPVANTWSMPLPEITQPSWGQSSRYIVRRSTPVFDVSCT